MNSLNSPPIDATLWDQQNQNSFVVSNGQIVDGGFWAAQTINGFFAGFQLFLNATAALQPYNYLNLDGVNSAYIWGDNGLAAAHFTPASSVPEPSALVSAVLGTACIAGCCARGVKLEAGIVIVSRNSASPNFRWGQSVRAWATGSQQVDRPSSHLAKRSCVGPRAGGSRRSYRVTALARDVRDTGWFTGRRATT